VNEFLISEAIESSVFVASFHRSTLILFHAPSSSVLCLVSVIFRAHRTSLSALRLPMAAKINKPADVKWEWMDGWNNVGHHRLKGVKTKLTNHNLSSSYCNSTG